MPEDWRTTLANARKRLGLSRARLGQLAGLSEESIRAYELGRRHPTLRALEAIIHALNIERAEANALREAAGFAPVHSLYVDLPYYFYGFDELQEHVDEMPWPAFVANEHEELVVANRTACALWRFDVERERLRRTGPEMNLLAIAAEADSRGRIVNWDEAVGFLLSLFKGSEVRPETAEDASPYFQTVLSLVERRDPARYARIVRLADEAPPRTLKVRFTYPIVWRDDDCGVMRFLAVSSSANEKLGLSFNDWHPRDAATWEALEKVKQRR